MKHPHPIQISIPLPCSEDWNKMTPQEQGRFCDSCQKCVVDLTNFSDAELYQYLLENKGKKACGRFRPEQLNRPIQIPPQPHSQLYKWMIAAGLALVLTSAPEMKTFARVPFVTAVHDTDTFNPAGKEKKKDKSKANTDSLTISGYIKDADTESGIINAQIRIIVNNKLLAGTITDMKGYFELTIPASDTTNASLIVNYIGYHEHSKPISALTDLTQVTIHLTRGSFVLGGFDIMEQESKPPPIQINKYEGGHSKTIDSDEIEKGAY